MKEGRRSGMQGLRIAAPDDETVLDLEPIQGLWTEEQYLKLTDHSRRLIEFTSGRLEVLPMPTERHQAILEALFLAVRDFIEPRGGRTRFAPMRLRVRADRFREPDLLVLREANDPRRQNRYWLGADVVMEIVSHDDPDRDLREKRADYAEGGIAEYWIVDPANETITVLRLEGDRYAEHGVFRRGHLATSVLLTGFAISVDAVLDAS
jgi:Uma2 family endonuclease